MISLEPRLDMAASVAQKAYKDDAANGEPRAIAIAQASAFIVVGIFPRDRDPRLVDIDHNRE
jgi:hypothetical protein